MPFPWGKKNIQKLPPTNLGRLPMERSKLAIERLNKFRFFSSADYAEMQPDIGAMSSSMHYIGYGADERRRPAKQVHIARTLATLANDGPQRQVSGLPSHKATLTVGMYVNSHSNIFMHDISGGLADLLRGAGHNVLEYDENSDIEARPPHCIYVAPHEFFTLGKGPQWVRDDVLADACMYCTEQVQTKWFWECLHFVLMAKSVVDMAAPVAAAFSEVMPSACIFPSVGKTTAAIPPETLSHPLMAGQRWWTDRPAPASMTGRPLDLCFLGTVSPSRARFFARNAEKLSRYESFLYLRTANATLPMNGAADEAGLVMVAQLVARNARVLLNIHRDEFPYFEWHRLVHQGMANGAVVVSEPCFANPEFEPGIHFLTEERQRLMQLLDWTINDKDGRKKAAEVSQAAAAAVRDPASEARRADLLIDMLTACDER